MVNELLGAMSRYSTQELQDLAQSQHRMKNGIYFKLAKDGTLSEPYVYNDKVSVADDWFAIRDFWAQFDAQKMLDLRVKPSKKFQSAVYLVTAFKMKALVTDDTFGGVYNKLCETEDEENSREINRSGAITPLDREACGKCLDMMKSVYKDAYEKAKEAGAGNDTIVKIFLEEDLEKYQEEGKRYIYMYRLFHSNKLVMLHGKISGQQSMSINYNEDKRYNMPSGMATTNYISLEDAYRMYFIEQIFIQLCSKSNMVESDGWQFGKVVYIPYDGDLTDCYDNNTCGYKIVGINGKNGINISAFSINDNKEAYRNNELKNILGVENLFIGSGVTLKQAIHKFLFVPKEDDTERKRLSDSIEEFVTNGRLSAMLKNHLNNKLRKLIADTSYHRAYNIMNTYLNVTGVGNMDVKNMDINRIESDEEYYFAAGQLAAWLSKLGETENAKKLNRRNFIEAQNPNRIKLLIKNLMASHGDKLRNDKIFNNLVAKVLSYEPKKNAGNMLIVGMFADNQLYKKKDSE